MKSLRHDLALTIASALFLWLAFTISYLWWLGFVGVIPLLLTLVQATSGRSAFWHGWVFGVIYYGLVVSPMWSSLPLAWLGIESHVTGFALVTGVWLLWTVVPSLCYGLLGYAVWKLRRCDASLLLALPAVWVVLEWSRALLVSLFVSGPESLIGPHWTMGTVGYLLSSSVLVRWASVGGVYALSFFVVFVNAAVYWWWVVRPTSKSKSSTVRRVAIVLGLMFIVPLLLALVPSSHGKTLDVALLRTNFPARFTIPNDEAQERLASHVRLLREIAGQPTWPDLIVFPEDARFGQRLLKYGPPGFIEEIFGDQPPLLIDSGRSTSEHQRVLSQFHFRSADGQILLSDKRLLVPYGEYLPWVILGPARLFGGAKWVAAYESRRGYDRGENTRLAEIDGSKVGGRFCSEIVSPGLFRQLSRDGAEVLVNATSHSAFYGSPVLYQQYLQMAKVRAVENNRYLLLAGNGTQSLVISNTGQVVDSSGQQEEGIVRARAPAISQQSVYVRFGDWVVWASVLIVVFAFARQRRLVVS